MASINLNTLPPNPTVEQIVALYRKLTGKEPTPAELDELKARVAKQQGGPTHEVYPDAIEANADWPKRGKDVKLSGVKLSNGFTLVEVLVVIAILIVIAAFVFAGVKGYQNGKAKNAVAVTSYSIGEGGFHVIKIDGCEYIAYAEGMMMNDYRVYCFTHKGNCSNPIHQYKAEQ